MDKEKQQKLLNNDIEATLIEMDLPFFKEVPVSLDLAHVINICECIKEACWKVTLNSEGSQVEKDFAGQDGVFNLLRIKLEKNSLGSVGISSKDIETMHLAMCLGSNAFDVFLGRSPMGEKQKSFIDALDTFFEAGLDIPGEVWFFWNEILQQ